MKILLVCPHRNTIELWAPLFQQLAALPDTDVRVLTSHMTPQRRQHLAASGYYSGDYQLTEIGAIFQKLSEKEHTAPLTFSPAINAVVRQAGAHIVYVVGEPGYISSWQTMRACRKHTPDARVCMRQAQNICRRWPPPFHSIEQYNYRHLACVFANGPQQVDVLRCKGYRGRTEMIPLGVDTGVFHKRDAAGLRSELGLEGRFIVGYVGKLTIAKGIPDLLGAFELMPDRAHLLLIGSGPLERTVREFAEKPGIGERVTWINRVSHTSLPEYFSAMDVMVLPSVRVGSSAVQPGLPIPWMEQFGRVLIEAMACETMVIGSSSGAIPEVIGEAGIVFDEGDPQDLANKLLMVIHDEEVRRRCAGKGLQQVREKYSWCRIARRYVEVFSELMDGARR